MALPKTLQGIQHFFGSILPNACSCLEWKEENIDIAFSWAKFCEQVYEETCNKNIGEKLDESIHHWTENPKVKDMSYCLESLKHSSSFLYQAFLENCTIENEGCLSKHKPLNVSASMVPPSGKATLATLCGDLLESLRPIYLADSNISFYSQIKAELFLFYAEDLASRATSEERAEQYLTSVFESLCESDEKRVILIHMFLFDSERQMFTHIQELGINWLILQLFNNEALARFIWRQTPALLRRLVCKYPAFCSYYMSALTKNVDSLEVDYQNGIRQWKNRRTTVPALSHQEIVEHFKSLLSKEDTCKEATLHHLNSFKQLTVWQEICSSL